MAARKSMSDLLPLLREYGLLDRKRHGDGVTPREYQRWTELKLRLGRQIPQGEPPGGRERRQHLRVPMRMLVQFKTHQQLQEAIITNISQGGLFISTAFAPEIGTVFTLCLRVDATREAVDVPCEVVSANVGDGFTTQDFGMGVKFMNLNPKQREIVEALFAAATRSKLDAGERNEKDEDA
jgi:uncharacterized protein (TIGR02266 family)